MVTRVSESNSGPVDDRVCAMVGGAHPTVWWSSCDLWLYSVCCWRV